MFGDSSSENTDRKQQQLSVVYNATGTENAANFRKAVLGALSAKTTSGELLTALLTGEADASPESLDSPPDSQRSREVSWSSVYVFSSDQVPGVTAAIRGVQETP